MPENSSPKHRRLSAPSTPRDVVVGTLVQIGRKYLFIDVKKKAIFYFVLVVVLSLIGEYFPLPEGYYLTQKHNVLNQYGVKIGWFWTLFLLIPFIWLTSKLHYNSNKKAIYDLCRLGFATGLWYFCTKAFIDFETRTGICHGVDEVFTRHHCHHSGGKWIPGFDISGHCFLLIYTVLMVCEESFAFKNWPLSPKSTPKHIPTTREYEEFQVATRLVQYLFIAMAVFHFLWDIQLVITTLYYHIPSHKILGALIGITCWFVTYQIWYPNFWPYKPVRRNLKSF